MKGNSSVVLYTR